MVNSISLKKIEDACMPIRTPALGQKLAPKDYKHFASWHSYRTPGQTGGCHTGNPERYRNPLWSDKSSQGRAAIAASLPATGRFCLSDLCSSRFVLR